MAALVSATIRAQEPAQAKLTIVSPADGAFASGVQMLRATLDPPTAASAVIFFVDGRQVCVVAAAPFECEWDAGRAVNEHQVRVVATLTGGGRVVQSVRTKAIGFADNVDVDAVQVTVTVGDGKGRYVRGLPQSAFHVFQDDQAQKITHFVSENVPLELIVAIDISGSMAASMPKLKAAVKEFLADVPSGNEVTLIGFNDTIFTLTRRNTNPADRVKAVDRLASWGATALYDVILRGVGMLGRETGRKALVVFTDGEDEGSHATLADAERALQGSDVTMYMIGQGRGVSKDSLKKIMERLSTPTGGRALFTDSIDELKGAFGELIDELSSQYLLGYAPESTKRDDTWHRIKVSVDGHSDVRARQGFRIESGR
jgi:VWFA-related protein